MATIGRNKAIVQSGRWKFTGWFAWITWLIVHIYFLTGFRNRIFVFLQWAWSYITYRRGARLIVGASPAESRPPEDRSPPEPGKDGREGEVPAKP